MKNCFKARFLFMIAFFVLCLFMVHSIVIAQEAADEDLKIKYAPILGEYEFVMEGGTLLNVFPLYRKDVI